MIQGHFNRKLPAQARRDPMFYLKLHKVRNHSFFTKISTPPFLLYLPINFFLSHEHTCQDPSPSRGILTFFASSALSTLVPIFANPPKFTFPEGAVRAERRSRTRNITDRSAVVPRFPLQRRPWLKVTVTRPCWRFFRFYLSFVSLSPMAWCNVEASVSFWKYEAFLNSKN